MPYLTVYHGNPHSRTHMYGWETEAAVENARKVGILIFPYSYLAVRRDLNAIAFSQQQVADLIGADKKEVIFTSGATECNNIAVKGVARFYKSRKNHIVTTQTVREICILIVLISH